MDWVKDSPQFTRAAVEDFDGRADGWLVAYAMECGTDLATNEVYRPDIKSARK